MLFKIQILTLTSRKDVVRSIKAKVLKNMSSSLDMTSFFKEDFNKRI